MTRLKTKAEWIRLLEAEKVPCGPINNFKEVFEDPQVQSRGIELTVPHPTVGQMKLVASPMHLSKTPVEYKMPPPLLGEHTQAVLLERLQLDAQTIKSLYEKGVL